MKTPVTITKEQLIIDNEELRSRLLEAEETLTAIRCGEVDAIVISGSKGEQVYSISSAETPYRTFIEEMNEGAVTLSKEGIILYCNQRFADFVHEPIDCVIGTFLTRFVNIHDILKIENLLAHQQLNTNDVLIISLTNNLYLKLSFHLLPPYLGGENCILIATDISELKKKEKELLELHRILKKQFNQSKSLRIDLINSEINTEAKINKLHDINEKLKEEITKYKLLEEELLQQRKIPSS